MWFDNLINVHSAVQGIVILSLICPLGLALGKIHVKGISLGIAFVFFVAIIAGHLGLSIDPNMLEFAESFGLTMFVYVLGLYVGPNFFGSMRHEGISLNLWSLAVILVGTLFSLGLCWILPISLPDMMGILCGATTNTPALGAAQQALQQLGLPSEGAALGCAVTYPLGVVGVILAMMLLRKLFVKPEDLEIRKNDDDDHTSIGQYVIVNPALNGNTIAEITMMTHRKFIISRVWRGEQVIVPQADTVLHTNDNVLVVTNKDEVSAMQILFGKKVDKEWNNDKVDWNAIDAKVESRIIVVTRPGLNGKRSQVVLPGWFLASTIEVSPRKVGGVGEVEEMNDITVAHGLGERHDGVCLWRPCLHRIAIHTHMSRISSFGRHATQPILISCQEIVIPYERSLQFVAHRQRSRWEILTSEHVVAHL